MESRKYSTTKRTRWKEGREAEKIEHHCNRPLKMMGLPDCDVLQASPMAPAWRLKYQVFMHVPRVVDGDLTQTEARDSQPRHVWSKSTGFMPWPVWFGWLGIVSQRERLLVWFTVRAHAWGCRFVPNQEHVRGNPINVSLSLSPFLSL